jgi:hypothetical protein
MSTLTIINGKIRHSGAALVLSPKPGTSDPCCCGCGIEGVSFPCTITFVHVDENRCEDDIFGLFRVNPDTGEEHRISTLNLVSSPPGCCNSGCPQTRIEIPETLNADSFSSECQIRFDLRLEGTNCCNTYTRFSLIASNGTVLYGTYFGQGGYSNTWEAEDLCGTASAP